MKSWSWLSKLSGGLARGLTLLSPTCKEATRLQSSAMDRKLSLFEKIGLRLHLLLCAWCRRYGTQLKFLRSTAHQCEEHENSELPQTLSPEARERIRQKLHSSQQ
jgi:hypothetical protein